MVVCRFFQEGRCKFGENCRNEHYVPQNRNRQGNQPQYESRNSYVQPQKFFSQSPPQQQQHFHQQQQHQQPGRLFGGAQQPQAAQYGVPVANQFSALGHHQPASVGAGNQSNVIREHLRVVSEDSLNWDKSGQWPFSCYAPLLRRLLAAGGGGATHIGGSMPGLTDYSPEEVRWQMYRHGGQGTVHQFVAQLQQLAAEYAAKRQALINMNERTVEFIVRYESGGMANPIGTAFASTPALITGEAAPASVGGAAFSFTLPASASGPGPAPAAAAAAPAPAFQFALPIANQGTGPASSTASPASSFSFKLPAVQAPAAASPFQGAPSGATFGFGAAQPATTSSSSNAPVDGAVYSAGTDLSEAQLQQFRAAKFCMGKIPLKPPPRDLCLSA